MTPKPELEETLKHVLDEMRYHISRSLVQGDREHALEMAACANNLEGVVQHFREIVDADGQPGKHDASDEVPDIPPGHGGPGNAL